MHVLGGRDDIICRVVGFGKGHCSFTLKDTLNERNSGLVVHVCITDTINRALGDGLVSEDILVGYGKLPPFEIVRNREEGLCDGAIGLALEIPEGGLHLVHKSENLTNSTDYVSFEGLEVILDSEKRIGLSVLLRDLAIEVHENRTMNDVGVL